MILVLLVVDDVVGDDDGCGCADEDDEDACGGCGDDCRCSGGGDCDVLMPPDHAFRISPSSVPLDM